MSPAVPNEPGSSAGEHQIRILTLDGQQYAVTLRVAHDGIEYLGRLCFTDTATGVTYQDHAAVPGTSAQDAVRKATEFGETEIAQRCHRALSEKRRFIKLRTVTDEIINKIRYLNRVAVGLEKGMIDPVGGNEELDQIQAQLLEIVKKLRQHAGVEDEEPK